MTQQRSRRTATLYASLVASLLRPQMTYADFMHHGCFEYCQDYDAGAAPWQEFTVHPRAARLQLLIDSTKMSARLTYEAAALLGDAFVCVPPDLGYVTYTKTQLKWLGRRPKDEETVLSWLDTVRQKRAKQADRSGSTRPARARRSRSAPNLPAADRSRLAGQI